jgi:hypothetical protein|tara:strand:- start:2710 stop:2856 length:147 start_codon:yes stop_codon:yes gene_type:complete
MDLNEKIDNIKQQQQAAKELYIKCQGAIEFLEAELKEKEESSGKEKKK